MVRPEVRDEAEMIRLQGGEMPVSAMFESLEYLEKNGIFPAKEEQRYLEEAVADRFKDIIRRDLDPGNQARSFFRGPERAAINWNRLKTFAEPRYLDLESFRAEAGPMLETYLIREARAVAGGRNYNTLGLERSALEAFLSELDLDERVDSETIDRVYSVKTLDFEAAIKAGRK